MASSLKSDQYFNNRKPVTDQELFYYKKRFARAPEFTTFHSFMISLGLSQINKESEKLYPAINHQDPNTHKDVETLLANAKITETKHQENTIDIKSDEGDKLDVDDFFKNLIELNFGTQDLEKDLSNHTIKNNTQLSPVHWKKEIFNSIGPDSLSDKPDKMIARDLNVSNHMTKENAQIEVTVDSIEKWLNSIDTENFSDENDKILFLENQIESKEKEDRNEKVQQIDIYPTSPCSSISQNVQSKSNQSLFQKINSDIIFIK